MQRTQRDSEAMIKIREREAISEQLRTLFSDQMHRVHKELHGKARLFADADLPGWTPQVEEPLQTLYSATQPYLSSGYVEDTSSSIHECFIHLVKGEHQVVLPRRIWTTREIVFGKASNYAFALEGEYGGEWAVANINAARSLLKRIRGLRHPDATPEQERLLRDYTFQQNYVKTIQESLQSLTGAMAVLTLFKVPGFDSPVELAKEISRQGLLNIWASGLLFSDNATITFGPSVPLPYPLLVNERSAPLHPKRLQLSKQTLQFLAKHHQRWEERKEAPYRYETGRGCLAARPAKGKEKTAIDLLADLYCEYVEVYAKNTTR